MTVCKACVVTLPQGSRKIIHGSSVNISGSSSYQSATPFLSTLLSLWCKSRGTSEPFFHTHIYINTHIYILCVQVYTYIHFESHTAVTVNTRFHFFFCHKCPVRWPCSRSCIRCKDLFSKFYLLLFVRLRLFMLYSSRTLSGLPVCNYCGGKRFCTGNRIAKGPT